MSTSGKGYGLLPECDTHSIPFEECAVDLIGSWIIQVNDKPYEFNALTVNDTVSNLVKVIRIDTKTSAHIARKYAQVWLTRYPLPARYVHDNGVNLLDLSSNFFSRVVGLRMYQHQAKIHKLMQSANGCIRQ